jgi:hypothetical protein
VFHLGYKSALLVRSIYDSHMKKQAVIVFLLATLATTALAGAPINAAPSNQPCKFGGEFKVTSGKLSACLWVNGNGTWIQYPKRNEKSLNTYEKTKLKAYQEVQKLYTPGPLKSISLNYDISENFPIALKQSYINQTQRASQFYDIFFTRPTIVNAYYQTEKDEKYLSSHPILSRDSESFRSWFTDWKKGKSLEHNIGLVASYFTSNGKTEGHTGVLVGAQSSEKTLRLYSEQVVAHEYFHVVQDFYKYSSDQLGYEGNDGFDRYYPPIFREGSANTISFAVSMKSFEDYLLFYQIFLSENKGKYAPAIFNSLTSNAKIISALKLIEKKSNSPDAHWAAYPIGALVFEWLIAEYGIEGYKSIIRNQELGKPFAENLKISVGITPDQLYRKAAPHVLAGFKAAKGTTL